MVGSDGHIGRCCFKGCQTLALSHVAVHSHEPRRKKISQLPPLQVFMEYEAANIHLLCPCCITARPHLYWNSCPWMMSTASQKASSY